MKIQVFSDLHNEFMPDPLDWFQPKEFCGADAIIFAGDVEVKPHRLAQYAQMVRDWQEPQTKLIFLAGNHEHYGNDWNKAIPEYKEAVSHIKNVYYLEQEELTLGHGIRLLAATLWTQINPVDEYAIRRTMNDYNKIKVSIPYYGSLSVSQVSHRSRRTMEWLREKLEDGTPTIVATHHAPSYESLRVYHRNHGESFVDSAYANHLDALILDTQPLAWIHGHTHDSYDYMIGETNVVCNPRGYEGHALNPNFKPDFELEF